MTPTTAAANSTQKLPHRANTIPAPIISSDPVINIALRPIMSAKYVQRKLMTVSPIMVKVMNSPIFVFEMSSADRKETRMSVEPPYAKRRINRCAQSSFVLSEEFQSVRSPSSLSVLCEALSNEVVNMME